VAHSLSTATRELTRPTERFVRLQDPRRQEARDARDHPLLPEQQLQLNRLGESRRAGECSLEPRLTCTRAELIVSQAGKAAITERLFLDKDRKPTGGERSYPERQYRVLTLFTSRLQRQASAVHHRSPSCCRTLSPPRPGLAHGQSHCRIRQHDRPVPLRAVQSCQNRCKLSECVASRARSSTPLVERPAGAARAIGDPGIEVEDPATLCEYKEVPNASPAFQRSC
jgi:hypothetical protein